MNKIEEAKKIIAGIIYITLATVFDDGRPWNSPVYAAFDENYNFFWVSPLDAEHSANIRANRQVAIVIYNSTVPEGTGVGVYISAKAYELIDQKEIEYALKYHYGRKNKSPRPVSAFLGDSPRRVYKAVPEKFWINEVKIVDGHPVDVRSEIDLLTG